MVKFTSSDALAVLRKFDMAGDEHVPRHVDQLSVTHPAEINTLASFRFNKTAFHVLIDETAEDDTEYISQQINIATHESPHGELIANPRDSLMTYGLPYKGKDVYLFEEMPTTKRLDVYLAERHADISRSTWQKYIKNGYVSINKQPVTSPKADVRPEDAVTYAIPPSTDYSNQELPVVYKDEHVIVINKPVGVLTHSKGALNDEFTVADFFRRYTTYNLDTNRPGIVHRLDRDTSGILIGARTPEAAHVLQKQFADRKAKKTYYAVVDGTPKEPAALIDLPIGRNPAQPSSFRVDTNGKSAQTAYKVIRTNGDLSLLELRPKTGRTHQLRVHMSYIGTPIHGDKVYGKVADRLYLHAAALEITTPKSERHTFNAPVPTEFETLVHE